MMAIALMFRPWDVALASPFVIPRMLADDLLVYTRGIHHKELLCKAADFTHTFLADMGAVVAPTKSFVFSSCSETQHFYSQRVWPVLQARITVVSRIRDLGGQINTTGRHLGQTINERIAQAIVVCKRIRYLDVDLANKARLIRSKVLPMALYGVENSYPSEASLHKLQSTIVDALGAHGGRRCNAMVFNTSSKGDDLDPEVQQTSRRIDLFKRMWAKHPAHRQMARDVMDAYTKQGILGTSDAKTDFKTLKVAPPLNFPGRGKWKPHSKTNGPIGYMIASIATMGAALDCNFLMHRIGEVDIHICSDSKHHVHNGILKVACNARSEAAAQFLQDCF